MQFQKITQSSQYRRVLSKGSRYSTPSFVAFYNVNNSLDGLHIGIIASRKVGGAVLRNFCKRRLRAALRNLPFPSFIPKGSGELGKSQMASMRRASIIHNETREHAEDANQFLRGEGYASNYEVVIIARSLLGQIEFDLFEKDLSRFFRKLITKL